MQKKMVVIRLSKKKEKYFINIIDKKKSVFGKKIKNIGYFIPFINYGKSFFLNYKIMFFYIKNGAKISKRIYYFLRI